MPAPAVQPSRVSRPSKSYGVPRNTPNALYLSPAQAAPPLTYHSERSDAYPTRPVALVRRSVVSLKVALSPEIPNGCATLVLSPILPPDAAPSMPRSQLDTN